jgi:hypothetical protein
LSRWLAPWGFRRGCSFAKLVLRPRSAVGPGTAPDRRRDRIGGQSGRNGRGPAVSPFLRRPREACFVGMRVCARRSHESARRAPSDPSGSSPEEEPPRPLSRPVVSVFYANGTCEQPGGLGTWVAVVRYSVSHGRATELRGLPRALAQDEDQLHPHQRRLRVAAVSENGPRRPDAGRMALSGMLEAAQEGARRGRRQVPPYEVEERRSERRGRRQAQRASAPPPHTAPRRPATWSCHVRVISRDARGPEVGPSIHERLSCLG